MCRHVALLLLLAIALAGCQRSVAGIPSKTGLNELSDSQASAYCRHRIVQIREARDDETNRRASCFLYSGETFLSDSEPAEVSLRVCRHFYSHCTDPHFIDEGGDHDELKQSCFSEDQRLTCGASVGGVERCVRAQRRKRQEILRPLSSMSCDDLMTDEGLARFAEIRNELLTFDRAQSTGTLLPACEPLQDTCPDFL